MVVGTDDWRTYLVCPACSCECVHPTRVEIDRGGDVVDVDADGVGFASRASSARGVIILLHFTCEEGDEFVVSLKFHKGTTFVAWRLLSVSDPSQPPAFRTIWRD